MEQLQGYVILKYNKHVIVTELFKQVAVLIKKSL